MAGKSQRVSVSKNKLAETAVAAGVVGVESEIEGAEQMVARRRDATDGCRCRDRWQGGPGRRRKRPHPRRRSRTRRRDAWPS